MQFEKTKNTEIWISSYRDLSIWERVWTPDQILPYVPWAAQRLSSHSRHLRNSQEHSLFYSYICKKSYFLSQRWRSSMLEARCLFRLWWSTKIARANLLQMENTNPSKPVDFICGSTVEMCSSKGGRVTNKQGWCAVLWDDCVTVSEQLHGSYIWVLFPQAEKVHNSWVHMNAAAWACWVPPSCRQPADSSPLIWVNHTERLWSSTVPIHSVIITDSRSISCTLHVNKAMTGALVTVASLQHRGNNKYMVLTAAETVTGSCWVSYLCPS